jgi:hypothetical protein
MLLVHCFAGCEQGAVIDALRSVGVWPGGRSGGERNGTKLVLPQRSEVRDLAAWAARIWSASSNANGTPVESYLRRRGLTVSIPASIRFHYGLPHPKGSRWPAMVALVTGGIGNTPIGVHRTFLSRDGTAKAPVEPAKMMLGPCGGGIVSLGGEGGTLMIGEGIETCLSVLQATGFRAWAALSTSGLRKLALPDDERDIIILADADVAGEAAAQVAAHGWVREGRRVRITRPSQGMDFNDMLNACCTAAGSVEGQDLARVQEAAAHRSSYESGLSWR